MGMLNLSPDIYVPSFELKVDNQPLPEELAKSITAISASLHYDPPSSFSFSFNDATLESIKPDSGIISEGKSVELGIGYVSGPANFVVQTLIKGEITAVSIDFPSSGPPSIQIEGFDLFHRANRGSVYRVFRGETPDSALSDSEIVEQISNELELDYSVEVTPARSEPRTQNYKSNKAFIEEIAGSNNFLIWMEDKMLHFQSQRDDSNTIKLEWGKDLINFNPRLSLSGQVENVEVRGWDPVQKQNFRVSSATAIAQSSEVSPEAQQQVTKGSGGESLNIITDAPVSNAEEAQTYLDALIAEQQQNLINASGSSLGRPDMKIGTILEISGVGRFDGEYEVKKVDHSIGTSGYQCSFDATKKI